MTDVYPFEPETRSETIRTKDDLDRILHIAACGPYHFIDDDWFLDSYKYEIDPSGLINGTATFKRVMRIGEHQ